MANVSVELDSKFTYKSLDLITGSVHYQGYEADTLILHLTGNYLVHWPPAHIRNYVRRTAAIHSKKLTTTWEFLRVTQSVNCSPAPSTSTPFTYRLPEALIEITCPLRKQHHLLIPATISCERPDALDDLSPADPLNARIEYKISVDLLRAGCLIGEASIPFRVAPRAFAVPGVYNPPPEYDSSIRLVAEVSRAWGGKVGSLFLELPSPLPLLTSLEEYQQTTFVPLTLVYCPGEIVGSHSAPPQIFAVHCRLEARTTSRLRHSFENEKGDAVTRFTFHTLNKVHFSKLAIPVWCPISPNTNTITTSLPFSSYQHKNRNKKCYSTNVKVPVTLMPKGTVVIPVFDSCLVDRSYILHLTLQLLPSSAHGSSAPAIGIFTGLSNVAFAVPVWIFAAEYIGTPGGGGGERRSVGRFTVPEIIRPILRGRAREAMSCLDTWSSGRLLCLSMKKR